MNITGVRKRLQNTLMSDRQPRQTEQRDAGGKLEGNVTRKQPLAGALDAVRRSGYRYPL